jgi:hypothetical protein
MSASMAEDIIAIEDALNAAERDARALLDGLTEDRGAWRAETGSWSVAECLDHLATANRVYLDAMRCRGDTDTPRTRCRRSVRAAWPPPPARRPLPRWDRPAAAAHLCAPPPGSRPVMHRPGRIPARASRGSTSRPSRRDRRYRYEKAQLAREVRARQVVHVDHDSSQHVAYSALVLQAVVRHANPSPAPRALRESTLVRTLEVSRPSPTRLEVADEYARLKQALAHKFEFDREAYTDAKYPFVARVLGLSRADQ